MALVDFSKLFDQEAYSDIIIKFGEREIRCHKVILCESSDYFKPLCGPGSQFAESKMGTIELKDEAPTALQACLRYIYTFKYVQDKASQAQDWEFHQKIAAIARKYLIKPLELQAYENLKTAALKLSDPKEAFRAMCSLKAADADSTCSKIIDELCEKNIVALMKQADFREWLDQDNKLKWTLLDRYICGFEEKQFLCYNKSRCSGTVVGTGFVRKK